MSGCPSRQVLDRIGDTWSVLIVGALARAAYDLRAAELRAADLRAAAPAAAGSGPGQT